MPITFVEREQGESKMSGEIVREAWVRVTGWGLRHRGAQLRSIGRRRDHAAPVATGEHTQHPTHVSGRPNESDGH